MYSIDSTSSLNKSFSSNSNAGTVYVYSGELLGLAIEERTHGHVIEHAINSQIKQARARDLSLGVFVAYNGGVEA